MIHAGIAARNLNTKQLLSEIGLIQKIVRAVLEGKKPKTIPDTFILGPNHSRFFFNKGLYIFKRHIQIVKELRARKVKVKINLLNAFSEYPPELYNNWEVSDDALALVKKHLKPNKTKSYMEMLLMDTMSDPELEMLKAPPSLISLLAKKVKDITLLDLKTVADRINKTELETLLKIRKHG